MQNSHSAVYRPHGFVMLSISLALLFFNFLLPLLPFGQVPVVRLLNPWSIPGQSLVAPKF